jgi:hypothetical protein
MCTKQFLFFLLVLTLALANSSFALELKVDIAYPDDGDHPDDEARQSGTAKPDWSIWANNGWEDMAMHDMAWADTNGWTWTEGGVWDSGLNFRIGTLDDGKLALRVEGMIAGDPPSGFPTGDHIANSFLHDGQELRPLGLVIYGPNGPNDTVGPPAGEYTLISYHNDPSQQRDPMAGILVYGIEPNHAQIPGGGGVEQAAPVNDVNIQNVTDDNDLVPSVVVFTTDGSNLVRVQYGNRFEGGKAVLNAFILIPGYTASSPRPRDLTEDVCPDDALLTWTPGPSANKHDVYFGTDFNDVNTATDPNVLPGRGRQDANEYDATSLVDPCVTYYWRIDEVNESEPELWKGKTWSFTINDGNAHTPYPDNGETNVELNAVLSWGAGCYATSHDVYFSTSFSDVSDETTDAFIGNQLLAETTYDPPGDLEGGLTYYWKINEVNDNDESLWKGEVWSFSATIDPNMRIWYRFEPDDPCSDFVKDSSGNEHHGRIAGFDDNWVLDDGRFGGGSIAFNNNSKIEDISPWMPTTITDAITIACWLKDAYNPGDDNWVFALAYNDDDDYQVRAAVTLGRTAVVEWQAGNDSNDVLEWDMASAGYEPRTLEGWHHWAFVKDEIAGTITLHFDGLEVDSNDQVAQTLHYLIDDEGGPWSEPFAIGARPDHDGDLIGMVDDFRLYDKALTADEILVLFRGGEVELAWAPIPSNSQGRVPPDANLAWGSGDYTEFHDVYLGTSFDDVNDADTTSAGIYRGQKNLADTTYEPPGGLALDTTYYWRIDEVNDPNLWKGNVWKFTTANYIIVDDFEQYDTDTNKVFNTWEDGNVNGTGSFLDLGVDPFDPTHAGNQSMLYIYDNSIKWDWDHYWSEAELPFSPARDFTDADVKALTLYFYGDPGNDASDTEELYVGLTGSLAEVRYSDDHGNDNNDLKLQEWTEWNIEIADFIGVDPCAVASVLIGFGDRDNTDVVGGEGEVYFDDIRLYMSRCVPAVGSALDLNGNCIVGWGDVAIIGNEWLKTDLDFRPPVAPPAPIGWWKLDGDANDSSVNANHGTAEGTYAYVAGRIGPNSIEFSGAGGRVLVPDDPALTPAWEVTVSAWVNPTQKQDGSARVVVKGADNKETYAIQMDNTSPDLLLRDPGEERVSVESEVDLEEDEWAHIAGSYDGSKLKFYVNGHQTNSEDANTFALFYDANGLAIGNRSDANDREFIGKIDDVQVYDVAISQADVVYLASDGSGYVPVDSPGNIYDLEPEGQRAVNMRDVAMLLTAWLEEKLWP